jgi:hypothetical protein
MIASDTLGVMTTDELIGKLRQASTGTKTVFAEAFFDNNKQGLAQVAEVMLPTPDQKRWAGRDDIVVLTMSGGLEQS